MGLLVVPDLRLLPRIPFVALVQQTVTPKAAHCWRDYLEIPRHREQFGKFKIYHFLKS